MDRKQLLAEIKKELSHYKVNVKFITEKTLIKDIGLDSLDLMQMIIKLEKKLNKHFDDEKLMKIKTIKDLIDLALAK